MAIDTAAKRSSAVNVGSPWRAHLPFPDGTIDQGDRHATAFVYSGILAGEGVEPITACVVAVDFYVPGAVEIDVYTAGPVSFQVYTAGVVKGQVCK